VEDQRDTRRLVDQARGLLMDRNGLSEREAFAFIRGTAMERRARVADIAREIIEGTTSP
jgi:response regulator NasT